MQQPVVSFRIFSCWPNLNRGRYADTFRNGCMNGNGVRHLDFVRWSGSLLCWNWAGAIGVLNPELCLQK